MGQYIAAGSLIALAIFIVGILLGIEIENCVKEPRAIDVYRGRTSLQITYDNGHADSTVIFKEESIDSLVIK